MSAAAIVAQLRAQRLQWHEVAPGVRVQLDTPSSLAMGRLAAGMQRADDTVIPIVAGLVRAWEGVTGEMLLGAGVGGSDPVPATAELAELTLADRPEWLLLLATKALQQSNDAAKRARAASGNSVSSSTGS